jgi:F-type H+-transporting ATPase subunit epsilon
MKFNSMHLKILLPFKIFLEEDGVKSIVTENENGFFGLLPNRLDCTSALVPGILTYVDKNGAEKYVAVDEGVLIKTGADVFVSVRNAIGGADLGKLREAVQKDFLNLDEQEKKVRSVVAKLEGNFIRRFLEFHQS